VRNSGISWDPHCACGISMLEPTVRTVCCRLDPVNLSLLSAALFVQRRCSFNERISTWGSAGACSALARRLLPHVAAGDIGIIHVIKQAERRGHVRHSLIETNMQGQHAHADEQDLRPAKRLRQDSDAGDVQSAATSSAISDTSCDGNHGAVLPDAGRALANIIKGHHAVLRQVCDVCMWPTCMAHSNMLAVQMRVP
jgi:hypothetical protein